MSETTKKSAIDELLSEYKTFVRRGSISMICAGTISAGIFFATWPSTVKMPPLIAQEYSIRQTLSAPLTIEDAGKQDLTTRVQALYEQQAQIRHSPKYALQKQQYEIATRT